MSPHDLLQQIKNFERPKRKAISSRFPFLKKPILCTRIFLTKIKNRVVYDVARKKSPVFLPNVVARHQSVLLRKLGSSDMSLQQGKIKNLKLACEQLNGLIIEPNQIFSLWESIGEPTYKRGYVDGMLLSNGEVIKGVGGGLCQLSNFLCWIFLHAETEIVERYHHSLDVFPDSGRVLPFGSGATCLYNLIDLKVRNASKAKLQLKIWLTGAHLKGQLLSDRPAKVKFSLQENFHLFAKYQRRYYRVNEISRLKFKDGKQIARQKIFTNFAPVLYKVTADYLSKNHYQLVDLDRNGQ